MSESVIAHQIRQLRPESKRVNVSINSYFEYLGDKQDFKEFLDNKLLRRTIEREIEIIGEAINRALKQGSELQIPYFCQAETSATILSDKPANCIEHPPKSIQLIRYKIPILHRI